MCVKVLQVLVEDPLMVEFGLQRQKFFLGDAAHHTTSNGKTIAVLPCTKAFYTC